MRALFTLNLFLVFVGALHSTALSQEYMYSPLEKPDPFDPTFLIQFDDASVHPLQSQPLSKIQLSGTIIGRSPSAVVAIPEGDEKNRTYIVKVGDRLGSESGTVTAVLRDRIIIRVPIESPGESKFSRFQDIAMTLRGLVNGEAESVLIDVSLGKETDNNSVTKALTSDVLPDESETENPYTKKIPKRIEMSGLTGGDVVSSDQAAGGVSGVVAPSPPRNPFATGGTSGRPAFSSTRSSVSNPMVGNSNSNGQLQLQRSDQGGGVQRSGGRSGGGGSGFRSESSSSGGVRNGFSSY